MNSWTWFLKRYAPYNHSAWRLRFLSLVLWNEVSAGEGAGLTATEAKAAGAGPVWAAAVCTICWSSVPWSCCREGGSVSLGFLALQETGRSSVKLWQLCLDAVSTALPWVFRACLEYLAPEICSCFCSDKSYQMYFISSFLEYQVLFKY